MTLNRSTPMKLGNSANYSLKRLAGFAVDKNQAYHLMEAMNDLFAKGWSHIYVEVQYDEADMITVYGFNAAGKLKGGRSKVNGDVDLPGKVEPPEPGMYLNEPPEKPAGAKPGEASASADVTSEAGSGADKGKGGKGKGKAKVTKTDKVDTGAGSTVKVNVLIDANPETPFNRLPGVERREID